MSFIFASTVNNIGDTGATSLSESLESNTTLTALDLSGETKERRHACTLFTNHFFYAILISTGGTLRRDRAPISVIGGAGAVSLSEALTTNTTLTELSLESEYKRKKTHKRYPSTTHFFPFLFT